jgi:hypothetical protein
VVPRARLAVLKRTSTLGKGSSKEKKAGVVLKARGPTRDACRPGSSTDTFWLRLLMVDDHNEAILDKTRTDLTCDRRIGQQKFFPTYRVENCAGSVAASRRSNGEIEVTATTEDGELFVKRTLKCKD